MLALVRNPERRYRIWKAAEGRMTKYSWDDCRDIKSICAGTNMLFKPFPREWFGSKKAAFEDIEVVIPSGTEEYLTSKYGDYMKLPPKEQQVVRHQTELIDLNTPYPKYRGIYYCTGKK